MSERMGRRGRPCLRAVLSLALGAGAAGGVLAEPLQGQATLPPAEQEQEETRVEVENPVEWNFERVPVTSPSPDVSLQERWAAPFAVISRGRTAPREPRAVVVLRDSATARRAAAAQAEIGQSAAAVEVEEGGEEPAETSPAETAVQPTPTPPATAPRAATATEAQIHRVAYGETWYGLAREYRVSSRDLAAANPDVDPERLRAGTVLRIPQPGAADAAPRTHTVTRGDTLFGIARRYGVSAAAIRSANDLTGDVVRLGQTLVIPREEASR